MSLELIKCARCAAKKPRSSFDIITKTGAHYKTCNTCRAPIPCPRCAKIFTSAGTVSQHIKAVHDKIKDIVCDMCEYKCADPKNLRRHLKDIHDKLKEHRCTQCEYASSQLGNLQQHIKAVHNRIKDYKCTLCAYTSTRADHLREHIKVVHDQIRDNICPRCNIAIAYVGGLRKHIQLCAAGSSMSTGEFAIKKALDAAGVQFQQEMRFPDCRDTYPLPFDFYLREFAAVIEFDGPQHFKSILFWGGDEFLAGVQRRDSLKNEYCDIKGIRMCRVKYTDQARIPEIVAKFLSELGITATQVSAIGQIQGGSAE